MPQKWVQCAQYELSAARGERGDALWVMTYGHKIQSFMKIGGQ